MSTATSRSVRPIPTWLSALCIAFAVVHLTLIGLNALSARSGPWPVPPPYADPAPVDFNLGPRFATVVNENLTLPYYLGPLRMTHNYHFASDRPPTYAAYFEAHVKDKAGNVKVLKFPDEKANAWVRHRQEILAQHLAQDQPMAPRGGQNVFKSGTNVPNVIVWDIEGQDLRLKSMPELKLEPSKSYLTPSPWTSIVADAYARHLLRQYDAASVEIVRCTRPVVIPILMYMPDRETMTQNPRLQNTLANFTERKAYFGEQRRD
jgi:hypothetical protein